MSALLVFGLSILVIAFIIGAVMVGIGATEYEEGLALGGLFLIILSVFLFIILMATSHEVDSEPDRHVKASYEDLCVEIGGEYLELEGEKTCVVEN